MGLSPAREGKYYHWLGIRISLFDSKMRAYTNAV